MIIDYKELLYTKNYLSSVKRVGNTENYECSFVMRNGYEIPIIISFSPLFPVRLPTVYINEAQYNIPSIPHITRSGMICYLDEEGVLWNDNPAATLDFVFKRVEQVLLSNTPQMEYHREFSYYFSTLEGLEPVLSTYVPNDSLEEISVMTKDKKPYFFLGDDIQSQTLQDKLKNRGTNPYNLTKALYIPLDITYKGDVPQLDKFWTNKEINELVSQHLNENTLEELNQFAKNKRRYYYLINLRLLTGEKVLIGLWYERTEHIMPKKVNPIVDKSVADNFYITPLFVLRNDDATLIERGGGVKEDPRVLLIGCGSIGSDLLFLLARSGIKQFTLIDDENLEIENSYRHFLGMDKSFNGKSKVELLKDEFEKRYPSARINAVNKEVLTAIENGEIYLNDFDLILVAIGNPNVERRLNYHIVNSSTPAVFTWVEAYGIGGHALVVNNSKTGCYECLIKDDLTMYQSLAGNSDKPFIKNMNGCAGSYTPYGSVDSMETALLASRMALRMLDNDVIDNPLVSWKGSAKTFEQNGYSTSERFTQSEDTLKQDNFDYINDRCKTCSNHREVQSNVSY